jgi:hypothetical protein
VKKLNKSLLPALIATALASTAAFAQDSKEPILYTTTDEGKTILTQGNQTVEVGPGEAATADESGVRLVAQVPDALGWPCSLQVANDRKFPAYQMDDLPEGNKAREIVRRYLEDAEVIEPSPRFRNGGSHGSFSVAELMEFVSPEYWYMPENSQAILADKRPDTLLVSLYVGINKAVIDNHAFKAMQELHGDSIPTLFVFNDTNVVPVSYFGPNVSMEEVLKAYTDRGIRTADVPMWELGDININPSGAEFEKLFDNIPALEDIPPDRQAALQVDLEKNGFSKKPIFVSVMGGTDTIAVDQPERVRVAMSMGIKNIPTLIQVVEVDVVLQRCGPGLSSGSGADGGTTVSGGSGADGGTTFSGGSGSGADGGTTVSGGTTPPGGAIVISGSLATSVVTDPDPNPDPPVSPS